MKTALALAFALILPTAINAAATTNTVEETLRYSFPQLLWPRSKLEFDFAMKAEMRSAFDRGSNSDAETLKWAKRLETTFRDSKDREFFTTGWSMTGCIYGASVNFKTRKHHPWGIDCETEMLFNNDQLIALSLWTDSNVGCATLYRVLTNACGLPGKRDYSPQRGEMTWNIVGKDCSYNINLVNDHSDKTDPERGMTIFLKMAKPTNHAKP